MPLSRKWTTRPRTALPALVAAFLLLAAAPLPALVIDRIVATVNGEAITLYDLYKAELPALGKVIVAKGMEPKSPQDRTREKELLDKMIEEKLLLQRANERGLTVSQAELDEAQEKFKSENKLSDDMLVQGLAQRGLTVPEFRDFMSRQITKSKLYNAEVRQKVVVAPEEVEQYYRSHLPEFSLPERVRIRHILLLKKEGGDREAEMNQAAMVAAVLAAGSDFQETARQYSQDSSAQKGDLSGYIQRGDYLPELEKAIFDMRVGQVSPVIETALGYHIVKLEVREPAMTRPLADVAPEISPRILEEKIQGHYRDWLDELKRQAVITIKL